MSLSPGSLVELVIEKPAAGGRMIARHEGQVVLVAGAIPGERIKAHVDRVEKRLAFASAGEVLEPSPDRRDAGFDSSCGGCVYAHIAYERQIVLKAEVVADAFLRIGRIPLESVVAVAGSPVRGYRMRARMHVHGGRAGFFREGTHQLCDAATTGQLLEAASASVVAALDALGGASADVVSIEVSENVAATERAIHLEVRTPGTIPAAALASAVAAAGLTGCSARSSQGAFARAGDPAVSDPLDALTAGRAAGGTLRRHAASFFQANRFLLPGLVSHVLDLVPSDGDVLDLYAGVGLFSVALAAAGRHGIVAVEGDRESGADLLRNASPYPDRIRAVVGLVEDLVQQQVRDRSRPGTLLVDPPRTGMSREAMDAIPQLAAGRILYISCDMPTMARDARRLLDAGYRLTALTGFDLFPNTPHLEAVGVFDR
jgi:23S rRNA (uracil1939-C5)-methyltransferase